MPTFTNVYVEPGAYAEYKPTVTFVTIPGLIRAPAFIGVGETKLKVENFEMTRSSEDTDVFGKVEDEYDIEGTELIRVWQDYSVGISQVKEYRIGTDCALTDDGKGIVWLVGGNRPNEGEKYLVNFYRKKVDPDYAPRYYFRLRDVYDNYGEPTLDNSLSLAAQIAFEHGSNVVLLAQVKNPNSLDSWKDTLESLKNYDLTELVILKDDSNLRSIAKAHVESMSTVVNRKYRSLITSVIPGEEDTSIDAIRNVAKSINSKRVILVYPGKKVFRVIGGKEVRVPNFYMAAALAGLTTAVTYEVGEPLTWKNIVGFSRIILPYSREELNLLASSGVTIIESVGPGLRVRHCLTTTQSGKVEDQEASIVEVIDFVAETSMKLLEGLFVGTKFLIPTTLLQAQTVITAYLNSLVSRNIISAHGNLRVVQNTVDPRQMDVSFTIRPVYPLNWIYISFSLTV